MANLSEEFSYIISAKDLTADAVASAKAGIQNLKSASQDAASQMERHWAAFKSQWVGVTAAVAAAAVGIREAWGMMRDAADYIEQMQLLDALASKYGQSSDSIVKSIQRASDGMISMGKAAEVAGAGLAKGLSPKQLTDLAHSAQVLADFMGVKVEDAFAQFAAALETGRTRSITAAIGITEMTEATENQEKAMTKAEKAMQAYNAIMTATAKIESQLGEGTDSLADKMERFEVQIKDLKTELGIDLLRAGMLVASAFNYLAAGMLGLVSASERLWGQKENSEAAWQARNELIRRSAEYYKLATSSTADLTAAMAKNAAAKEAAAAADRKQAQSAADVTKALQGLAQAQAKVGEEQLKLAQSKYGESLKAEGVSIAQMRASLQGYLATLTAVYDARIDGEQKIMDMMARSNISGADLAKQQAEVLKAEKAFIADKLAAWKAYYDALASQHKTATDKMKTLTAELAALEKEQRAQQQGFAATMLDLQTKLAQARGKAATDESIYAMKLQAIEQQRADANKLSGAEQVAALEKVKQQYAALTGEVTTESKVWDTAQSKWITQNEVILTSEKQIQAAIQNVASVTEEIASAQQKLIDGKKAEMDQVEQSRAKLAAAMNEAKAAMTEYEAQILKVADELAKLDKEIAIKVNDAATPAIRQIQAELNRLVSTPYTVTVQINQVNGTGGTSPSVPIPGGTSPEVPVSDIEWENFGSIPSAPSGGNPLVEATPWTTVPGDPLSYGEGLPSYAFGTRYVPHTGAFRLHEGEAVIPKKQAQSMGQTIHFSPSISISGGGKSPEQLAREIVKPLRAEMRRLEAVGA